MKPMMTKMILIKNHCLFWKLSQTARNRRTDEFDMNFTDQFTKVSNCISRHWSTMQLSGPCRWSTLISGQRKWGSEESCNFYFRSLLIVVAVATDQNSHYQSKWIYSTFYVLLDFLNVSFKLTTTISPYYLKAALFYSDGCYLWLKVI